MIKGLDVDNDAMRLSDYLQNQITKLGVEIRLGKEFTPSAIGEINPDAIMLAPGGIPTVPEIPGMARRRVKASPGASPMFLPAFTARLRTQVKKRKRNLTT
jgi:hypothetical protein